MTLLQPTTADIREEIIRKFLLKDFVIDRTGAQLVEIVGASFRATEPTIFGKPNDEYIAREIAWYESQSLYVADIPGKIPPIWTSVSSDEGKINSNYGYLIFSADNCYQYENTLATLLQHPESRRAVMIYNRPEIQHEYCEKGMNDFICTNAVSYLIRDGKLNAVVQMRSNDVVFGYANDFAWQKYVLNKLAKDLTDGGLSTAPGVITWQAASLHLYSRHFNRVEELLDSDGYSD
jgi:thymidylate synthase